MKVIVITGDDIERVNLRVKKLIHSAKEKSYRISKISNSPTRIENELREDDLFLNKKFILVEKLSLLSNKDLEAIHKNLTIDALVLCVVSEYAVPASKIKYLGKDIKIESFTLPKIIWKFLDSLKINNAKNTLELLDEVVRVEPIELVFHLISQRFIQLYLAKTKPSELKLQSWQVVRLQSQAEDFSGNEIKVLIDKLSELDVESKTGKGELKSLLDFFIATNLE